VTRKPHKIIVAESAINQRLDKYLTTQFEEYTRSHLQQLISNGNITVNSTTVKSGYRLRLNDNITIDVPDPEPSHIIPENIPINILYEDDDLLVINKSAGLIVHPGAGHKNGTLVNALLYHCKSLSGINGVLRPGIVHRLDRYTSGLMVVAKNDQSHIFLSRQFDTREITREYFAIVWGVVAPDSGKISTNLDRSYRDRKKMSVSGDRGRKAITNYEVIENLSVFSFLRLFLETGRTHQIRVHLNHINHPVFGDPEYNGRSSQIGRIPANRQKYVSHILKKIERQALHAKKLSFIHPATKKKMMFDSELPDDIEEIIRAIKEV